MSRPPLHVLIVIGVLAALITPVALLLVGPFAAASLGLALQASNQLVWQLSAYLPYGFVGPAVFLILAALAVGFILAIRIILRRR